MSIRTSTTTSAAFLAALPAGLSDATGVATVKRTPKGLRFTTLDSHASHAIELSATRRGLTVRVRYDNLTNYYLTNVTGFAPEKAAA